MESPGAAELIRNIFMTTPIITATPRFVKARSDFTFRILHVSEDPGTSRKIHTSPETGHLH